MKISCPHCHKTVRVNAGGRKSYSIPVAMICNALREGLNGDGTVNFHAAARILTKKVGGTVTPAFVWQRFYRSGKKLEDILDKRHK